jgi:hypothetical protein
MFHFKCFGHDWLLSELLYIRCLSEGRCRSIVNTLTVVTEMGARGGVIG